MEMAKKALGRADQQESAQAPVPVSAELDPSKQSGALATSSIGEAEDEALSIGSSRVLVSRFVQGHI